MRASIATVGFRGFALCPLIPSYSLLFFHLGSFLSIDVHRPHTVGIMRLLNRYINKYIIHLTLTKCNSCGLAQLYIVEVCVTAYNLKGIDGKISLLLFFKFCFFYCSSFHAMMREVGGVWVQLLGGQRAHTHVILVLCECIWNMPVISLVFPAFDNTSSLGSPPHKVVYTPGSMVPP